MTVQRRRARACGCSIMICAALVWLCVVIALLAALCVGKARADGLSPYDVWVAESTAAGTPINEAEYVKHAIRVVWVSAGLDPAPALAIAWCESRYNPKAIGDHGLALGVFQIRWDAHAGRVARQGWARDDLFDPWKNAQLALQLYSDSRGWRPWLVCSQRIPGGW